MWHKFDWEIKWDTTARNLKSPKKREVVCFITTAAQLHPLGRKDENPFEEGNITMVEKTVWRA